MKETAHTRARLKTVSNMQKNMRIEPKLCVFQAVLENEETEAENAEAIMSNLVANQKLLPFKFTSTNDITGLSSSNGISPNFNVKLTFTINECYPKCSVRFVKYF